MDTVNVKLRQVGDLIIKAWKHVVGCDGTMCGIADLANTAH